MFDGLGSEWTVTNSSQTVTGTATYEGFGQTVATTGSNTDPYMFAATRAIATVVMPAKYCLLTAWYVLQRNLRRGSNP
jgi:hypothetical protein